MEVVAKTAALCVPAHKAAVFLFFHTLTDGERRNIVKYRTKENTKSS